MEKGKYIMDCGIDDLVKTTSHYIEEFHDALEIAKTLNKPKVQEYVYDSYIKLIAFNELFKDSGIASTEDRNTCRMLIKETNKMIVIELVIPTDYA